ILNPGSDADLVRRFENEAVVLMRLMHPHTLKLISAGEKSDGRRLQVTDLLVGQKPQQGLKTAQGGRPGPRRGCRLIREIVAPLGEAHAQGIVHRDLKPGNIFIQQIIDSEVARLLDFGIARVPGSVPPTAKGVWLGTPFYISPEQFGSGEVDGRSDLFSLG